MRHTSLARQLKHGNLVLPGLVSRNFYLTIGVLASVVLPMQQGVAADIEKANNTTALNAAGSYTAGGPPGTADRILVNSVMTANQTAALGGNLSIDGILIDSTATKQLTISGSNTLTLGASGILLQSGTGTLIFNGPALTLGANQTWDFGSKGTQFNGGTTINTSSFALTINSTNQIFFHNTTPMTLNAMITGTLGSVTLDSGTTELNLTNANSTFTGGAAMSTGTTLTATSMNTGGGSSAVGTGQILLKGGTFKYTGNTATTSQNVVLDARFISTFEVTTAGQTLTLSNFKASTNANSVVGNGALIGGAGNIIITNVVADSTATPHTGLALTKFGSGTLTLTAANTLTGTTTINEGKLALGSGSAGITGSPLIDIKAGASFDTTAKSFTMLNTQTFKFTLDGAFGGSAGLLEAGVLNITSGIVDFAVVGTLDDAAYIFAKYTTLTGAAFSSISNTPAGYTLDYNYLGGNQIALVAAVPEPSTYLMIGTGLALLCGLRRVNRKRS